MSRFIAVPLERIISDVELPGDLYLYVSGHFVKYKHGGGVIPTAKYNEFILKKIEFVFRSFDRVINSVEDIFIGDHIAFFYQAENEFLEIFVRLANSGIEHGDKILICIESEFIADLISKIRISDINIIHEIDKGSIKLLNPQKLCRAVKKSHPDEIIVIRFEADLRACSELPITGFPFWWWFCEEWDDPDAVAEFKESVSKQLGQYVLGLDEYEAIIDPYDEYPPKYRWPTREELLAVNKRVIIFGVDSNLFFSGFGKMRSAKNATSNGKLIAKTSFST